MQSTAAKISTLLMALDNCRKSGNAEWIMRHDEKLTSILKNCLPSGSGFDRGITLDEKSTAQRLILNAPFHHMDEHGYYAGWGDYQVIVAPHLAHGISLRVTGRDRNGIKDYIAETFHYHLTKECGQ